MKVTLPERAEPSGFVSVSMMRVFEAVTVIDTVAGALVSPPLVTV
jgi:hypothetical protein